MLLPGFRVDLGRDRESLPGAAGLRVPGRLEDFGPVPVQGHRGGAERASDLAHGGGALDPVVAVLVVAGEAAEFVAGELSGAGVVRGGLPAGGVAGQRPEFQQCARCLGAVQTSDAVRLSSFRPQLLAIDDRLGEIQLGMLRGASPTTHDELVKLLGILTDAIQELGWYAHDLEDIAEMVDGLPGMRPGAQQHFDRHRRRVTRMQENTRNIRDQAKDALSHYSEVVAGRQAQVINALTIVATVFLPLSFLTGYFGMNFRILTADVQTTLWQFILLGLLLPVASAALSLLLIRRLEQRLGIRHMGQPPS